MKQSFIKVILTKNQGRSKRNKERVRIRKSRCIELDKTCCCIRKFNAALSLCGVLKVALYFSKDFLEVAVRELVAAKALAFGSDCGLFTSVGVQLVVFYTTIEAQVVFETLFALAVGQLAIVGQLRGEVHLWRIRLFFGSRK